MKRFARRLGVTFAVAAMLASPQVLALDAVDFRVSGADEGLTEALRGASLVVQQQAEGAPDAQDLFAAARADYGRILAALYARGHYSGVIRILVDGREAASIAALDAPSRIGKIDILVDPGPRFAFGGSRVSPLAAGTVMPKGFARGQVAESGVVADAVAAGIDGWRNTGHAKARVASEEVVADHDSAMLETNVTLNPGPKLRFGPLAVTGQVRMRPDRIVAIAGLPTGKVFSPAEVDRAADRLRRTGVFSSVTMTEDDEITAPDLLGITATVAEQKRRRYSFGAEMASADGLSLNGYWLHRNLLGGAERLKIEGAITNIGAGTSGVDYSFGISLERPATPWADTTARFELTLAHLDEVDYYANVGSLGFSFSHVFSDSLTARAGVGYSYARGRDPGGEFVSRNLSLPLGITWDTRDVPTNATKGFYLDGGLKPFYGLGTTDSGAKITFDGRAYQDLGSEGRLVLAGRLHGGAILGSTLLGTPRDELFFSGGGGSVRGHPYRSLGVDVLRGGGPAFTIGGLYYAAASAEVRTKVTERIGVVGFVDVGSLGVSGFADGLGGWHAGAGLGVRYDTGFGPIRLDVAAPIKGATGDGVQIYIGLGQSF